MLLFRQSALATWDLQLAQGIAAVDEQLGARASGGRDALQHLLSGSGVASVQGADAHRENQVEGLLAGLKHELFARGLAHAHPASGDFCGCG